MSTYVVTGGAGFIGSHIATELVKRGETVRVLDDFSTGKRENLTHLDGRFDLIEGSITFATDVAKAVDGADYVLHQGALPSVPRSVRDPLASNATNVTGTLNVLWAAKEASVKRVVVASSSSVYGNTEVMPKVETMPTSPLSPYAVSKLATETYAMSFWHSYGLETVALRYFNVFGTRQDPYSQYSAVIPRFLDMMRKGETPTIHGDGEQSRDFTYVENVVQANLLAATVPGCGGQIFNCACQDRVTLNDLVNQLNDLLGTDITPEHGEDRVGDVKHSLADISKAREMLGYRVIVPFSEGLRRLVEATEITDKSA
jgi:UDP-N-acetylglucosamine/UDP-N-acetyl-alpha-D-glucosaminouronate 4-epimerase